MPDRPPRLVTVPYAALVGRSTPTPDEADELAARIAGQQVRVGGTAIGHIRNATPTTTGLVVELVLAGGGVNHDSVEAAIVAMYATGVPPGLPDPSPGPTEETSHGG